MESTLGLSFPFDSGAISQYQGWPFTDFFQLGDQAFGLASNAVFLLGGDDDAGTPIRSIHVLPMVDNGTNQYKRVRYVMLSGPGGEELDILVRTEETEWQRAVENGGRFALPSSCVGQHLQCRIEAVGPVEINGITLQALNLGLRQRG